MYFIVERERLPEGRHYETLPDGRCIVGAREAKTMDTLEGVTVVHTVAALERLRLSILREQGINSPQTEGGNAGAEGNTGQAENTVEEDTQEIEEEQNEGKEDDHGTED